MIVTAFGSQGRVSLDAVVEAIVFRFDVAAESFKIRRYDDAVFIALMADEATASRMATNNGLPSSSAPVRIHCRRWSRQAFATGAVLPALVDIELRGIPAHTWEVSTAENLLNPYGWLERIRPETRNREDYSAFKCSAWCFKPDDIPRSRDLYVVEPALLVEEQPPSKRALVYPITFSVMISQPRSSTTVHPDGDDSDNTGHRRLRRHEASHPVNEQGASSSSASQNAPATLLRDRVGTSASGLRDEDAAAEACASLHCAVLPEETGCAGSAVSGVGDDIVAAKVASPSPIETTTASGLRDEVAAVEACDSPPLAILSAELGGVGSAVSSVGDEFIAAEVASTIETTAELLGIDGPSIRIPVSIPEANPEQHAPLIMGGPPIHEVEVAARVEVDFPSVDSPTLVSFEVPPTPVEPGCMTDSSPCRHATPRLQPTSPLAWFPAEDVLPLEPVVDPDAAVIETDVRPPLVYSRRRRAQPSAAASPSMPDPSAQAALDDAPVHATPLDPPAQSFINQISRPLENLLTPQVAPPRRRRQQPATTQAPRRSRRIAKLPPEAQQQAAVSVCCQLGFTNDQQQRRLSDNTMDKYTEFFSKPLILEHVRALAALLGKEMPPVDISCPESRPAMAVA